MPGMGGVRSQGGGQQMHLRRSHCACFLPPSLSLSPPVGIYRPLTFDSRVRAVSASVMCLKLLLADELSSSILTPCDRTHRAGFVCALLGASIKSLCGRNLAYGGKSESIPSRSSGQSDLV